MSVSLNRLLHAEPQAVLPGLERNAVRDDTWQPDPGTDLDDGRALHDLLYTRSDLRHPRSWCSAPTGFVVARALEVVEGKLAHAREGDVIRVLDYGAGTGFAAIEFLKTCYERGIDRRLERLNAELEVHLADLPSSWFALGFELLRDCTWTRFHSLRALDGGFRRLSDVTGGRKMDAVMANMVFHLIPPAALERVAQDLAHVLNFDGRMIWSSPDLGPPSQYAVLFHDANRALRKHWRGLLTRGRLYRQRPLTGRDGSCTASGRTREAVCIALNSLDAAAMTECQARADRRILARANAAANVQDALARAFGGETEPESQTHELLREDVLDTLLVPSNQAEYLSEIHDRELREDVIRELMFGTVLPSIQAGDAGTALGVNVQWTLGSQRKRGTPR